VPAAVGDRYDVLPTHRVGRPQGAGRASSSGELPSPSQAPPHFALASTGGCGDKLAPVGKRGWRRVGVEEDKRENDRQREAGSG
jgi:hypothetical protein